jgi:hypothetical protein
LSGQIRLTRRLSQRQLQQLSFVNDEQFRFLLVHPHREAVEGQSLYIKRNLKSEVSRIVTPDARSVIFAVWDRRRALGANIVGTYDGSALEPVSET